MMPATAESSLPRHIAIIMDGNGRWASLRGLPRAEGHRAGARAVRATVEECRRIGIRHLTLYAFSSENWSRPAFEITALFSLLLEFLIAETPRMEKQGISLRTLGDISGLPLAQQGALGHSVRQTAGGTEMILNLALNYGGRSEIVRAARCVAGMNPAEITEDVFSRQLYTAGQPDPDLLIRTSGELRLSNFLLYQCAYSELYFTPVLWPDFNEDELRKALADYRQRERRFGSTPGNPSQNGASRNGS